MSSQAINRKQPKQEYSAIANTEEEESDSQLTEREIKFLKRQARKRKWVRRLSACNDYLHGACKKLNTDTNKFIVWVALASVVVYKTNFFRQVWENPHVNSVFLNISLICIAFMMTVLVYISIVGPWILRKSVDLEKDLP